jgi:hypothetical protein
MRRSTASRKCAVAKAVRTEQHLRETWRNHVRGFYRQAWGTSRSRRS